MSHFKQTLDLSFGPIHWTDRDTSLVCVERGTLYKNISHFIQPTNFKPPYKFVANSFQNGVYYTIKGSSKVIPESTKKGNLHATYISFVCWTNERHIMCKTSLYLPTNMPLYLLHQILYIMSLTIWNYAMLHLFICTTHILPINIKVVVWIL